MPIKSVARATLTLLVASLCCCREEKPQYVPNCAQVSGPSRCAVIEHGLGGTPTKVEVYNEPYKTQPDEEQEARLGRKTSPRDPGVVVQFANGSIVVSCVSFDDFSGTPVRVDETRVWINTEANPKSGEKEKHEYKLFPFGKRFWIRGVNDVYYCQGTRLFND
jgi:hypothetical protein